MASIFNISKRLLTWYKRHQRELPFRGSGAPYHVWLSEIILQQTRVAQGLPFYERFLDAFPTIHDLANATEEEVLRLWQGLGYYTRARNLHQCAKRVVKSFGGKFPEDEAALRTLPGIGPYTAAAIASIAFGQPVPTVDGNVYRVLTRLFGIEEDISSPKTQRSIAHLAGQLLDKTAPGDYNQALMEFGALYCTPKSPRCEGCIFQDDCVAKRRGQQLSLPIKRQKPKVRHRYFHYLLLQHDGSVYLKKRLNQDIWRHLYDFYLVETPAQKGLLDLDDPLLTQIRTRGIPALPFKKRYRHQLTHQRIHAAFYLVMADDKTVKTAEKRGMRPFSCDQLHTLPLPKLVVNFLQAHPPAGWGA